MGVSQYTPRDEVDAKIATIRSTFKKGATKDLRWRKWQLKQIWWMIDENQQIISDALTQDLGRTHLENIPTDIMGVKKDVLKHITHLEEWTADVPIDSGFIFSTIGSTYVRKEPLGTVLILGTWNYSFATALTPMIAAIAAGCTVILKPSEVTRACEKVLSDLIPKYLDASAYAVVTGGVEETTYLLSQKFEHIFYTGSTSTAKHIAAAAAKHLTPTTLELGGQAAAIVTETANLDLAAKRIAWSKYTNAGQICLSTNHIFVAPKVHDSFIDRFMFWVETFSSGAAGEDMVKIVNERHFDRLQAVLDRTKGKILTKGKADRATRRLPLTVIDGVTMDDSLLENEIFGPLAPVVTADYKTAVEEVGKLPTPLGLYIFSDSQQEIDYILDNTLSGGVTINDILIHAATDAPFGGVGESGTGAFHGKYGVDAFTHERTVVQLPLFLEAVMGFRYPPFNMADLSKSAVKNSIGFKKGEGLQDQKIRRPGRINAIVKSTAFMAVVAFWLGRQSSSGYPVLHTLTAGLSDTLHKIWK